MGVCYNILMVLIKKRCVECGHEWIPRKDAPLRCPRCQNPLKNHGDIMDETPNTDIVLDRKQLFKIFEEGMENIIELVKINLVEPYKADYTEEEKAEIEGFTRSLAEEVDIMHKKILQVYYERQRQDKEKATTENKTEKTTGGFWQ